MEDQKALAPQRRSSRDLDIGDGNLHLRAGLLGDFVLDPELPSAKPRLRKADRPPRAAGIEDHLLDAISQDDGSLRGSLRKAACQLIDWPVHQGNAEVRPDPKPPLLGRKEVRDRAVLPTRRAVEQREGTASARILGREARGEGSALSIVRSGRPLEPQRAQLEEGKAPPARHVRHDEVHGRGNGDPQVRLQPLGASEARHSGLQRFSVPAPVFPIGERVEPDQELDGLTGRGCFSQRQERHVVLRRARLLVADSMLGLVALFKVDQSPRLWDR